MDGYIEVDVFAALSIKLCDQLESNKNIFIHKENNNKIMVIK